MAPWLRSDMAAPAWARDIGLYCAAVDTDIEADGPHQWPPLHHSVFVLTRLAPPSDLLSPTPLREEGRRDAVGRPGKPPPACAEPERPRTAPEPDDGAERENVRVAQLPTASKTLSADTRIHTRTTRTTRNGTHFRTRIHPHLERRTPGRTPAGSGVCTGRSTTG